MRMDVLHRLRSTHSRQRAQRSRGDEACQQRTRSSAARAAKQVHRHFPSSLERTGSLEGRSLEGRSGSLAVPPWLKAGTKCGRSASPLASSHCAPARQAPTPAPAHDRQPSRHLHAGAGKGGQEGRTCPAMALSMSLSSSMSSFTPSITSCFRPQAGRRPPLPPSPSPPPRPPLAPAAAAAAACCCCCCCCRAAAAAMEGGACRTSPVAHDILRTVERLHSQALAVPCSSQRRTADQARHRHPGQPTKLGAACLRCLQAAGIKHPLVQ